MKIVEWKDRSPAEREQLLKRPAVAASDAIEKTVRAIVEDVKRDGDAALKAYTEKLDRVKLESFRVSQKEFDAAAKRLPDAFKAALQLAVNNISKFHKAQLPKVVEVETMPGIQCRCETRPIENVGLYIPGGSAPLFSTALMLAIPAKLAGCKRVVLCSPPPVADEIVYAAQVCGVDELYTLGGAQAIAAMAFGTQSIPKVDKIFGPGNAFVTEAKRQASNAHDGAMIDMPAGPSEVLVIADAGAEPMFVAADLLSQAEHGPDSQVILLTPSRELAEKVSAEVERQLASLPRKAIAEKSLAQSRLIVAKDLAECVAISNRYAPEHLILQTAEPDALVPHVQNAGSVFVGDWSPEAVGDYASGTNHVLPTYGYAKTYSSLGLADFQKRMTVQKLSHEGLTALSDAVQILAAAEHLDAHRMAVKLRSERSKVR